ncbi:telo2 interacting protein 1 [Cochliomyia hominivorax]
MTSLEPFVLKIKPAMDAFLRNANRQNLKKLENELAQFNWMQMSIFNVQILVPLVLKLEELSNDNQDLRTGCLQCITLVTSKVYLKELTALRTMLIVVLKQVREGDKACTKPNLSEEIKLASVQCITECFRRSTSDVLEQFYTKESAMILGQILLTLVEFVEKEKYKKLIIAALDCLMVVFYVHDDADRMDVVLRNQVSNTIFIFLPKIVTVLYQTSITDDTIGETIKIYSIKALGRILCVIYEETTENLIHAKYDVGAFKKLLSESLTYNNDKSNDNEILTFKKNRDQLEQRMKQLQGDGRTQQWIQATSKKLRIIFTQTSKLRSHSSTKIRREYAEMCCLLMESCSHNLKDNFVFMLESVVALTEDEDVHIRNLCCKCIDRLQNNRSNEGIFDENSELLLDEHLTKLPRIIARCDDAEQYAEFIFLKGFLKSLSAKKLQLLFSIQHNLEIFCMCLLTALDLQTSIDLLSEEYSLREMDVEGDYLGSSKLPWRKFKNLNSERSIKCLHDICCILGKTPVLNRIIVDYLLQMIQHHQHEAMNEILLMIMWLVTAKEVNQCKDYNLVKQLLDELLDDKHWHLALEPDKVTPLKVNKHTDWFVDRTPGLYESAIEIRTQDYDSDDEIEDLIRKQQKVTISDAEFNILHTCIVLDCLGHCALYIGERFDGYIFQTLHKVLLKLAHSNSIIYKAANFALVSIQKSLRFNKATQLIEGHIDYITYHLNMLLKKTPESKSAIDILSVVLQFSSRKNLPHLEVIFETIYNECSKQYETHNVISYLKVFNAFLRHITAWLLSCNLEINDGQNMVIDGDDGGDNDVIKNNNDLFASWLDILNTDTINDDIIMENLNNSYTKENCDKQTENEKEHDDGVEKTPQLPRHINMIKSILQQVIKFLSSRELQLQILSLECLTNGIPLLHDYENELLPLVHTTWSPLVEKFRQKNALVLNRCFSLLEVLAINARDFITKRSLDDVIPFLKKFLQQAASYSAKEKITVQTQEYKLQLKLLKEFPSLIEYLDLDGKHLNEISEIISLYLSNDQPKPLQNEAILYYKKLQHYNGPLIYLILVKKSHLKIYQDNVRTILESFQVKEK